MLSSTEYDLEPFFVQMQPDPVPAKKPKSYLMITGFLTILLHLIV